MTVKELKALLSSASDDALVVLSKDSDGDRFSPLAGVDTSPDRIYVPENTWCGEISRLGPEALELGLDLGAATRCVVLWPTN